MIEDHFHKRLAGVRRDDVAPVKQQGEEIATVQLEDNYIKFSSHNMGKGKFLLQRYEEY